MSNIITFHISGVDYKLDEKYVKAATYSIRSLLREIKAKAEENNLYDYYLAYILMMYVITGSTLKGMGDEEIKKLLRKWVREAEQESEE